VACKSLIWVVEKDLLNFSCKWIWNNSFCNRFVDICNRKLCYEYAIKFILLMYLKKYLEYLFILILLIKEAWLKN